MNDFIAIPSIGNDDIDAFPDQVFGKIEFSHCNRAILLGCLNYIKTVFPESNTVVEIGVDRDRTNPHTSSKTILNNTTNKSFLLFIDIEDRSYISDYRDETAFLQMDSSDISKGFKFLQERKIDKIDLLFIDGWHSVRQVYLEWAWTEKLSDLGLVLLHDTNYHPGPKEVISKLNPNKWVFKYLCMNSEDNGIALVWRKTNPHSDYLFNYFSL